MKYIHQFSTFDILNQKLSEGLIKTNDLLSTKNSIEHFLYGLKFKFAVEEMNFTNNTFKLKINDFNYIFNIRNILEIIDDIIIKVNGYFPAKVNIKNNFSESVKIWNNNMWEYLIKNSNDILEISILFESSKLERK
jgi:hypothetical protein